MNNETELFQNDKGIIIKIDRSKDINLTDFGKATLKDRYLGIMNPFKICLQELRALIQMIICMHKEFITILVICGLCQLHLFCLMVVQKEVYQFHVF